jgi:hypothetical protein
MHVDSVRIILEYRDITAQQAAKRPADIHGATPSVERRR